SLDNPIVNNLLKKNLSKALNINVSEFSNRMVVNLMKYDSTNNAVGFDTINSFISGKSNINKINNSYSFIKNRSYSGNIREAGYFSMELPWYYDNNFGYRQIDTVIYCYRASHFHTHHVIGDI